jgi:hypothetical protein
MEASVIKDRNIKSIQPETLLVGPNNIFLKKKEMPEKRNFGVRKKKRLFFK